MTSGAAGMRTLDAWYEHLEVDHNTVKLAAAIQEVNRRTSPSALSGLLSHLVAGRVVRY